MLRAKNVNEHQTNGDKKRLLRHGINEKPTSGKLRHQKNSESDIWRHGIS